MKLTNETLEILKNFSGINTNIYFTAGKVIKTCTPQKNTVGIAEIAEEFKSDFGIWDLTKFLATLSFFESPELTFEDSKNRVVISDGKKKFYYYGSAKQMLTILEKDVKFPTTTIVKVELKKELFNELIKVSTTLSLPHIALRSDGKDVNAIVFDNNIEKEGNGEGNTYSIRLGAGDGSTYNLIFDTENLRFLMDSYDITVASMGKGFIAKFENKSKKLSYYTGLNKESTYTE